MPYPNYPMFKAAFNERKGIKTDPADSGVLCDGPGCHTTGGLPVKKVMQVEIETQRPDGKIRVIETGRNGFPGHGPDHGDASRQHLLSDADGRYPLFLSGDDPRSALHERLLCCKPLS